MNNSSWLSMQYRFVYSPHLHLSVFVGNTATDPMPYLTAATTYNVPSNNYKVITSSIKFACGSASAYSMHQPKEPAILKKMMKQKVIVFKLREYQIKRGDKIKLYLLTVILKDKIKRFIIGLHNLLSIINIFKVERKKL